MPHLYWSYLFASLWLWGCITINPKALDNVINPIANELVPTGLGRSLRLSQIVIGKFAGKTQSLRFEIDVMPNSLVMVGLTHTGITLFTVEQTSKTLSISLQTKDYMPFDPKRFLIDFKLAYWPIKKINAILRPHNFQLIEKMNGQTYKRILVNGAGDILLEITHPKDKQKEILLRHYDIPYTIRVITWSSL